MPARKRRVATTPRTGPATIPALVSPLLGMTLDLRRAYEKELRLLTELQHEIEVVRSAATPFPRRRQGLENLEHHFRELARSGRAADELFDQVRAAFDSIHHEAHDIEKEQRAR